MMKNASIIRKFAKLGVVAALAGLVETAAPVHAGVDMVEPHDPCCPPCIGQFVHLIKCLTHAPESCEAAILPGCYMKKIAENAGIEDPALNNQNVMCLMMICGPCCAASQYSQMRNAVVHKLGMQKSFERSCCESLFCCASGNCCSCGPTAAGWDALLALNETVNNSKGGAPVAVIADDMERGTEMEEVVEAARPALRQSSE